MTVGKTTKFLLPAPSGIFAGGVDDVTGVSVCCTAAGDLRKIKSK